MIPAHRLLVRRIEVAAVGEFFHRGADALKSLQLAGHIVAAFFIPALVQRNNTDFVTPHQIDIFFCIVEGKGEYAAQVLKEIHAFFAVQRKDYLAVAAGLEKILSFKAAADFLMIVDFAVRSKDKLSVRAQQGLPAAQRVNNGKTLVGKHRIPPGIDPAPVRPAVPYLPRHVEHNIPQLLVHRTGSPSSIKSPNKTTHRICPLTQKKYRGIPAHSPENKKRMSTRTIHSSGTDILVSKSIQNYSSIVNISE